MYNQRNDALLFLIIIAVVSLIPTAESQPEVLGHPYEENTWYSLRCESGQRWHCSGDRLWEVQPDGVGPFQRVELGTEFAKAIPTVPGDLDILLNKKTMGVYRCSCRREGGQMLEPRTIAYFFSKGQRFRRSPPDSTITVMKGDPLNISVYYLEFLPEAAGLDTMTLVEEASGDSWPAFLRNHTANFSVENPKPGYYHLVVTIPDHGNLNSTSFIVTIEDRKDDTPPTPPQETTGALDGWVKALIVIATIIVVAVLYCVLQLVIFGVLKSKMAKRPDVGGMVPLVVRVDGGADNQALAVDGHDDLHRENNAGGHLPLEVVHENPHREDAAGDHLPLIVVDENPHNEDDPDLPPLGVVDENPHHEDDPDRPPLVVVDENPHREDDPDHPPLGVVDENPHHENPHREDDADCPPLIVVDENPHHEDDADCPPLGVVNENPHHEDNPDRPPLGVVDENPHHEDDPDRPPLVVVDENPHHEDDPDRPPLGVVDENPHREDIADCPPLVVVDENPHHEDDPDRPPLGVVDENPLYEDNASHLPLVINENPHHEDDAGDHLWLPDVAENLHHDDNDDQPNVASTLQFNAVPQTRYMVSSIPDPASTHATDKSLMSPHEEECLDYVHQNQQTVQCTDHNGMYRAVDEVQRMPSSRHSGNSAERERFTRPWVQPSSSRSETEQPSVTADGFAIQSAVEDVPKPFN